MNDPEEMLEDYILKLERERDEALAQVAVLAEEAQKVVDNHAEGFSCQDGVAQGLPKLLKNLPTEARALLDRLRRAEAVVEALDRCEAGRGAFSCHEPHDCRCPKSRADRPEQWRGEWKCECGREMLEEALAAWEEGKA